MKNLYFITQSKGGIGKSALTYLIAQNKNYENAVFLDLDDATKTSTMQLQYLGVELISFLTINKQIDRGKFNDFLENLSQFQNDTIFCDLGSSISEQLVHYFNDIDLKSLQDILKSLEIELNLIVVIGGFGNFVQCMNYFKQLINVIHNKFNVKIAINDYFNLSENENLQLIEFLKLIKIDNKNLFHFNFSYDKSESTHNRIKDLLKSGKSLKDSTPFTKVIVNKYINQINL